MEKIKKIIILELLICIIIFLYTNSQKGIPEKLSSYNFFLGDLKNLQPNQGIIPYELNSSLFTDYASKLRFIKLPEGKTIPYNSTEVLNFPEGTILIKNFYYPFDERKPEMGRRIIETRLLIHQSTGWKAYPYIWNEEQTDAILEITGETIPVSYVNLNGKKVNINYEVPNINQCKGCHEVAGKMSPIGPSARQLNKETIIDGYHQNQLTKWKELGILQIGKDELKNAPQLVDYLDESKSLNERTNAYLDINCAHCHNEKGPAKNSGLFLNWNNSNVSSYGHLKSPVAAGRGSGNLKYDIVPGKPLESILFYRMNSTDPGIMMPEMGRTMVHKEGVELIRRWIRGL